MTLDIENAAKMKLIARVTDCEAEDGYSIVVDFIEQMNETAQRGFRGVLNSRRYDEYCGALVRKYFDSMPVWVLLEVGSFGTLVDFYRFCAKRWDDPKIKEEYYRLKQVKLLRNSSAHSSCIINGFYISEPASVKLNREVSQALADTDIGKGARRARLKNSRMKQIVTLFYTYKEFVNDEDVLAETKESLAVLLEHIDKKARYYERNSLIRSSFDSSFYWRMSSTDDIISYRAHEHESGISE